MRLYWLFTLLHTDQLLAPAEGSPDNQSKVSPMTSQSMLISTTMQCVGEIAM
jgi:hypothetical protein